MKPDRPFPWYRVKVAYGPYVVGHVYQPTGLMRTRLLAAGFIELAPITLPDPPVPVPVPEPVAERTVPRAAVSDREVRRYSNRGGK